MQAQDRTAFPWAVAQRTAGCTRQQVLDALDSGALLRAHVLRPTWHVVLPEDVAWMLDLTGASILRKQAQYGPRIGVDDDAILRGNRILARALGNGDHLTRAEIADALAAGGIDPGEGRAPQLLLAAEVHQVAISGAHRGSQQTWAAFDLRVPSPRRLSREEALIALATRYVRSHGPATVQDFMWWSGLTSAEARRGLEAAGEVPTDGSPAFDPRAHLLPNYDEYTVGYRHRDALFHPERATDLAGFPRESIHSSAVYVEGILSGLWRPAGSASSPGVEIQLFHEEPADVRDAIERAVTRFEAFLERPVAREISLRRPASR